MIYQCNVILAAEELRQVRKVARELRLMLRGIERFAMRDAGLGKRVEHKNIRRAALGLREDIQLRNEMRVESGGAPAFDIERDAFGTLRRQREFQLAAERLPVAFIRIFPAAKPFQTVGDVADFVVIDFIE